MANFDLSNIPIKNACHKKEGTCCMKCKYVSKGKDKEHEWKACSDSCIEDGLINYSCHQCIYNIHK